MTELENHIDDVAAVLKSLSNPMRLNIMCQLLEREQTVGELSEALKTTNANVSQHLTILRNQGVVAHRKDANFVYNSIQDQRFVTLLTTLQDLFCNTNSN